MDNYSLRKAAEMALKRLDMYFVEHGNDDDFEATQALRQALNVDAVNMSQERVDETAKREHEPFEYWNAVEGWVKIDEVRQHFDSVGCGTIYKTAGENRVPLYTAPPKREWVGLSDEEIITHFQTNVDTGSLLSFADGVRYAEAKLRDKNAGNFY